MRKLIAASLIAVMCFGGGLAWAGVVHKTLVDNVTINNVTTSASGIDNIEGADKVAFFVTYDETDGTAALSIAITCQISYDGTTWLAASFYDYAGGSTLQTAETLTVDGSYYFWFNKDLIVPQVKVIITPTGHDATHVADVSVYEVKKQ